MEPAQKAPTPPSAASPQSNSGAVSTNTGGKAAEQDQVTFRNQFDQAISLHALGAGLCRCDWRVDAGSDAGTTGMAPFVPPQLLPTAADHCYPNTAPHHHPGAQGGFNYPWVPPLEIVVKMR